MRSRQTAECGGNQDVRYQERSEMTLDYTKRFRWQEAGSQGSFHMWGSPHGQYEPMPSSASNTFGWSARQDDAEEIDIYTGYSPVCYC